MARKYSKLSPEEQNKAVETMSGEKFQELQDKGDVDLDDETPPVSVESGVTEAQKEDERKKKKERPEGFRSVLSERMRKAHEASQTK